MLIHPTDSPLATEDGTRSRLLKAATEIFLEEGFRAARVQDIAQRAGVRLSAINYHFSGKEGLYRAALRHHAQLAMLQTPIPQPEDGIPPQPRFRAMVRMMMARMLGAGTSSRIAQFMLREISNPTAALDELVELFSRPQAQGMLALLREICGPEVPQIVLSRAFLSLFGQCVVYASGHPLIIRVFPEILADDAMLDSVSNQIADFSWAGLMALRSQWERPNVQD